MFESFSVCPAIGSRCGGRSARSEIRELPPLSGNDFAGGFDYVGPAVRLWGPAIRVQVLIFFAIFAFYKT